MLRKRIFSLCLALGCLGATAVGASAAEVDSGAVYCFTPEDFSPEAALTGICITDLPERWGVLKLGDRVLRTGDVLTAEQVSRMTFSADRSELDQSVEVGYLPIYEGHVAADAAMTIAIRGRENKAPVAEDSALETYKNLPNTARLKVMDPEGEAMTFTITRQPKRGTLEVAEDGTFTYTPKKNKVGVDSFVYTAADASGKTSREATVTITILKPTDAAQYTDTLGKECRFAAEWMKHTGIFVGESLGKEPCFGPDKEVTRGEFVTMLVKALDIPTDEEVLYTGYTDDIPQWLQPYLAAAVRSGLTEGLDDQQTFSPDAPITGPEALTMIQNALNSASPTFAQLSDAPLTRADTAQVLYRAVKLAQADKRELV